MLRTNNAVQTRFESQLMPRLLAFLLGAIAASPAMLSVVALSNLLLGAMEVGVRISYFFTLPIALTFAVTVAAARTCWELLD